MAWRWEWQRVPNNDVIQLVIMIIPMSVICINWKSRWIVKDDNINLCGYDDAGDDYDNYGNKKVRDSSQE